MTRVRQAIIMVGGKGTRLLPLTKTKPKPILQVAGRPCIWYLVRSMARAGIKEIILACGYKPGIMETLGNGDDLGISIEYSYEDKPMGTAGAMELVRDRLDSTFVAANGDVLADLDIAGQIRRHLETGAIVTDALTPVDNPCEYGIAYVDDDLRITAFKDKPRPEEVFSDLINAGVYVIQRKVLDLVPKGEFCDFSMDIIPKIIARGGRVQGYKLEGLWIDVGRPRDLLRANLAVASNEFASGFPGIVTSSDLEGTVFVGEGSSVVSSSIMESCILGGSSVELSSVRHSLIMDGCNIKGSRIEDSILGDGCVVEPSATVSHVVLADGTVVRAGKIIDGGREIRILSLLYVLGLKLE